MGLRDKEEKERKRKEKKKSEGKKRIKRSRKGFAGREEGGKSERSNEWIRGD